MSKKKSPSSSEDVLLPHALTFADGYYAIWQCRNEDHARRRASEHFPDKVLVKVELVA